MEDSKGKEDPSGEQTLIRQQSCRWRRRPRSHVTSAISQRRVPERRRNKKKPLDSPHNDHPCAELTNPAVDIHPNGTTGHIDYVRCKSQPTDKTDEVEHRRRSRRRHSNSVCHNCEELAQRVAHLSRSIVYYAPSNSVNFHDSSLDNSSGPISFDSGIEQNNSLTYRELTSPNSSPRLCLSPVKYANDWPSTKLVNAETSDLIYGHNTRSIETQTENCDLTDQTVPTFESNFSGYFSPFNKHFSPTSNDFEVDAETIYQSESIIMKQMEDNTTIGTNSMNTTMKTSFSLTSLGQDTDNRIVTTTEKGIERPYHSLTKKRKDPNRELWRRSWGSNHSTSSLQSTNQKDDFWAALQQNYDYIMNNHLIDSSCKEATGELLKHNSHGTLLQTGGVFYHAHKTHIPLATSLSDRLWSLQQILDEYEDICNWLTNIQEELSANPEILSNNELRLARLSYISSNDYRRRRWLSHAVNLSSSPQFMTQTPQLDTDLTWKAAQLTTMWDNLVKMLTPTVEVARNTVSSRKAADVDQTVRSLRRWLHEVEGRLRPLTGAFAAARRMSRQQLLALMDEHQVLEREIRSRGSTVRAVGAYIGYEEVGEAAGAAGPGPSSATDDPHSTGAEGRSARAAKGAVARWHALYLRAIEWRLHLDACLAELNNKRGGGSIGKCAGLSGDSDEEPAYKHPRLTRPITPDCVDGVKNPSLTCARDTSNGSEADTEDSAAEDSNEVTMASLRDIRDSEIPKLDDQVVVDSYIDDEIKVADISLDQSMYEDPILATPPTVVKRKKLRDASDFKQTDRKSKSLGTFYFKHMDTDSDANVKSETSEYEDENNQDDTSEDEWTYTLCEAVKAKEEEEKKVDDIQIVRQVDKLSTLAQNAVADYKALQRLLCNKENIHRLVSGAEELVLQKAQRQTGNSDPSKPKKIRIPKSFQPLIFNEDQKGSSSKVKMYRIKEWLQQHHEDSRPENLQQVLDSCDASGEYTTGDSELDKQSASSSEDLTADTSQYKQTIEPATSERTISAANSPTHNKVTMRIRKSNNTTRPWSVSCLSQLTCVSETKMSDSYTTPTMDSPDYGRSAGMSISESALNTLTNPAKIGDSNVNNGSQFQGSTSSMRTTVQGNISSSTTINETCMNCPDSASKKRVRLRRKHDPRLSADLETRELRVSRDKYGTDRLVKSCSFSGRLTARQYHKHDRNTASDPSFSKNKPRYDSSTSDNDSDENSVKKVFDLIKLNQKRNSDLNSATLTSDDPDSGEQRRNTMTPCFKIGPDTGKVRPRLLVANPGVDKSTLLGLSFLEKSWEVSGDKDSDVDRSIKTAGTEEHSSFSEQAWDFYQEKYNSEPYSEAPDSDAARRLLEFGDDYRAFLDSQSDCMSSLSTHPDREKSPIEGHILNGHPSHRAGYPSFSTDDGTRSKKSPASTAERKKLGSEKRSPGKKPASGSLDKKARRSMTDGNLLGLALAASSSVDRALNRTAPNSLDLLAKRTRKTSNDSNESSVNLESPTRRRRPRSTNLQESRRKPASSDAGEADSELNDIRDLLEGSRSQLEFTEAVFAKQEASPELIHPNDYNELAASRSENIRCLEAILAGAVHGDRSLLSPAHCKQIQGLLRRWRSAEARGARGANGGARGLRRAVLALRGAVLALDSRARAATTAAARAHTIHTRQHLHRRIDALNERLAQLAEYRACMARLAAAARRLEPDARADEPPTPNALAASVRAALDDELADLFRAWQDIHDGSAAELASLESVLEAWVTWESGLRELRDLRELALVADAQQQSVRLTDDSGISDCCSSGSERGSGGALLAVQRALQTLRAAARRLRRDLAPASRAIRTMHQRMEEAEGEVAALMAASEACVEAAAAKEGSGAAASDPEPAPDGGGWWVWRVARGALPLQLALLALLCAAWLLEPRCCDSLNALHASWAPQLRYVRGNPPI